MKGLLSNIWQTTVSVKGTACLGAVLASQLQKGSRVNVKKPEDRKLLQGLPCSTREDSAKRVGAYSSTQK